MSALAEQAFGAAVASASHSMGALAVEAVVSSAVGPPADMAADGVGRQRASRCIRVVANLVAPAALDDGRVVSGGDKVYLRVEHVNAPAFSRFCLSRTFIDVCHHDCGCGGISNVSQVALPVRGSAENGV